MSKWLRNQKKFGGANEMNECTILTLNEKLNTENPQLIDVR